MVGICDPPSHRFLQAPKQSLCRFLLMRLLRGILELHEDGTEQEVRGLVDEWSYQSRDLVLRKTSEFQLCQ